jgi:phosphocarrier protein HPr
MIENTYTVTDSAGLHARPTSILVKAVTPFESEVLLEYKGKHINLKSIIAVMTAGVPKEAEIKVIANGSDEEKVITTVTEIMEKESIGVCQQSIQN